MVYEDERRAVDRIRRERSARRVVRYSNMAKETKVEIHPVPGGLVVKKNLDPIAAFSGTCGHWCSNAIVSGSRCCQCGQRPAQRRCDVCSIGIPAETGPKIER